MGSTAKSSLTRTPSSSTTALAGSRWPTLARTPTAPSSSLRPSRPRGSTDDTLSSERFSTEWMLSERSKEDWCSGPTYQGLRRQGRPTRSCRRAFRRCQGARQGINPLPPVPCQTDRKCNPSFKFACFQKSKTQVRNNLKLSKYNDSSAILDKCPSNKIIILT